METISVTYMQQEGATYYYSSSILYVLVGLLIGILPLIPITQLELTGGIELKLSRSLPSILGLFFLGFAGYHIAPLADMYHSISLEKHKADMLPTIHVACQRFLSGEQVYAPMPEIWPGAIMPYLPAMWLPFVPAVLFHFDMRWVTFSLQFVALFIVLLPVFNRQKKLPVVASLIAGLGLFFILNYLLTHETTYWSLSEEGVVVFFYLLLGCALLRNNYWLTGLAITGCMLSRYSFLFWVPIYGAYVFFTASKTDFFKLLIASGVSMALLFIFPFFIQDPVYFIHIPETYAHSVPTFWGVLRVSEGLYHSVGLYKFFTFEQTHLMFILQLITSFLVPLLYVGIVLWLKRRYAINERYIALGSLKVSLVFFYSLLQAPFYYLFIPPTLLSYVILFYYLTDQQIAMKKAD
jgi:hypothetical protein